MPPRINPWGFLGRLFAFFFLVFFLWKPIAPFYTGLLLRAAKGAVALTELSADPLWNRGTTLLTREVKGSPVIFYYHRNFYRTRPQIPPQGIPADWVMANLVLLVALMLATPAPSWRARFGRLALALGVTLALQAAGIVVNVKSFYSRAFAAYWSPGARTVYGFLDVFVQSFDTQLFPVVVWGGIHWRRLLALRPERTPATEPSAPQPALTHKGAKRKKRK